MRKSATRDAQLRKRTTFGAGSPTMYHFPRTSPAIPKGLADQRHSLCFKAGQGRPRELFSRVPWEYPLALPTLRGRAFWDSGEGGLERFGALVAQGAVQSLTIVEHFDVLKHCRFSLLASLEFLDLQLSLQ